ncbi:hypothetical protein DFO45_2690 [Azorhizobium sp. AG788]|uniref:hypothetical protein n=1 Tax=Azorhizobium sp. AG788 TaxID=2183897 RepID=UPI0010601913|nr:hypothetical protein [Azorhizobium sp. AG788]TDT94932.1 hypothetical protein DFO45_2690 [Azorhizobium sp. AG788]
MDALKALPLARAGLTVGALRALASAAATEMGDSVVDPKLPRSAAAAAYLEALAGLDDATVIRADIAEGARRGGAACPLRQTALNILRDCAPDDWSAS